MAISETEQNILNSLEEGDDHVEETELDNQVSDDADDQTEVTDQGEQEVDQGQGTDEGTDRIVQTQQKEQLVEQTDIATSEKVFSDAKGNLVDSAGRIVATAGPNRRLFEKNHKLEQSNKILVKQSTELRQQLQSFQAINGLPQQLGLSLPEVDSALRLMQAFKQNPAEAIKSIIVQAKANGVPLDLEDGRQAIDTQAISAMLDARLGPLVQERQAQEQHMKMQAEVESQVATFYSTYPDAIIHAGSIAKLITESNCTPEVAYWRLKSWVSDNQLDWSRSVEEQIAELQQQAARPQQQTQSPRPNVKPRVSGSSMASNANTDDAEDAFNATSSWRNIINQTLKTHGFNS